MTPKALVTEYTETVWVRREVDALDRFIAPDLIQHNANLPDGIEALRLFLPKLFGEIAPAIEWSVLRVIAEGDLVAVHSHAAAPGEAGQVVVDIYRVADGRIVEHWDVAHEVPTETAGGRPVW